MAEFEYTSPLGIVRLCGDEGGLRRVVLGSPRAGRRGQAPDVLAPFVDMLDAYFRGEGIVCRASGLCLEGLGPFPRRVYEALLAVPFGQMVGYGELAVLCGRSGSARAVGGAMGRNPLPIFIPCHRVVRSDGSLGGFSGGLRWKRELLRHEGHIVYNGPRPLRAGGWTRRHHLGR